MTTKAAVKSDFVEIQLSPAGVTFAGKGGVVQIANGHFSYKITATKPVRVLTSEWSRTLSRESFNGQPIFELTPAATVTVPAGADPQAQLNNLKTQEAKLESQIAQEGKK